MKALSNEARGFGANLLVGCLILADDADVLAVATLTTYRRN